MRRDYAAVGEQLAGVFEYDNAIAEQAPALLGMAGDRVGGITVRRVRGGTTRFVRAHETCLRIRSRPENLFVDS
jgi:hypothetical protein